MKIHRLLLATALALSFTAPALAQPTPDNPGPPAAARKRFEKLRDKVLKEKIGLSDAKAKQVVTIFQKYRAERRKTQGELRKARQTLRKLLEDDSNDQTAYDAALTKLHQSAKKIDQLRDQQFADLKAVLTPKEQAKTLRALQKVKRLMSQRRGQKGAKRPKDRQGPRGKGRGKRGDKPGKKRPSPAYGF